MTGMKKGVLITGLFLTIFIIMGLNVSAGWWSDFLSGMAVKKTKNQTNTTATCSDSDGGGDNQYYIAGIVTVCKGKCKSYPDKCSGKSGNLQEKYCKGTNVGTANYKCPNKACNNGACATKPINNTNTTCTDECTDGLQVCVNGSGYKTCGRGWDGDPCTEWSYGISECFSGQICSNGNCISSTNATTCTDSDITSQYTTGKNYAKFGTTCDSKGCQPDKCNNAESILEWYCYSSTQKGSISASCKNNFSPPRKCVNGVCVPT